MAAIKPLKEVFMGHLHMLMALYFFL